MDSLSDFPVNVIDIGVLAVLLISAVLAYARGFVHEVLSVGGWIGAIFATFYGFPYAKPFARKYIPLEIAADLTAGIVIFIVTLVFFSVTTALTSNLQELEWTMSRRTNFSSSTYGLFSHNHCDGCFCVSNVLQIHTILLS